MPSGVAGDMTVAALLDLGVPLSVARGAVRALGVRGLSVRAERVFAGAIAATRFHVEFRARRAERTHAQIDRLLAKSSLDPATRDLARRIFRRLADAEAEVHGIDVGEVHFHEVGALDAIADIVSAAACVTHLGARVVASPLPMGRGMVECRHGTLPLPAPATVGCLRGVPTYDAGIDAELVTPTGAAIVATVASEYARWPSFTPERIGWGAGTMELPGRPNALRAVLGTPGPVTGPAEFVQIEANIDDSTGEFAAHALEALLAAGALDAWAVPVTMKKGRPGLTLCALATAADADRLSATLITETTTLGVRRLPATRSERPRQIVPVETEHGVVPVKISAGPYGPPQIKPEFDACRALAELRGIPVREVWLAALMAAARR